ncbi:MAG: outer membrane lipoprotein carrier protein LolA [Turneriella sp.]|nr:outer membrane lipoprotein carrier protein LolA [Turneriella sp.]
MSTVCAFFFATRKLCAQSAYEQLKGQLKGLYSSFRASFAVTYSSGQIQTGKIYYQYPGKLRVETATGVIATNGTHLWLHNKNSSVCARQDVSGLSGGLLGLLANYEGSVQGSTYIFRKKDAYYQEIVVQVAGGMLRSVRLKHDDEVTTYTFSGVTIDTGISGSMFNYRPAGAQIVENPLNN